MDAPHPDLDDDLGRWLAQWERCLDSWLECGVGAPTIQARELLEHCADRCAAAGWREAAELARTVLAPANPLAVKAGALLDLIAWQHTAQRLYEAQRLQQSPFS